MNTYSHVASEASCEAAERIARMLWHDAAEDQADPWARLPDGGCTGGVAMLLQISLVVLLGPVKR
jgi:hypothetical protein